MTSPFFISLHCGPVDVCWLRKDTPLDPAVLQSGVHPLEWERASLMGSKGRRHEFLRSRYLVRYLTGFSGELPYTAEGAPTWPPGRVGSVSHKNGHVVCTVEDQSRFRGIGVDLELCRPMSQVMERRILRAEESLLLDGLSQKADRGTLLAAVFSFKEALFKCHFPLGKTMFYFHDARVEGIDWDRGLIKGRLMKETSPWTPIGTQIHGVVTLRTEGIEEYVVTTVVCSAA